MNLQLQGQPVAVFGCTNGIGRAIAQSFADEGAQVFGFDHLTGSTEMPFLAGFHTGDVASLSDVEAFAARFQSFRHVVFCVGIGSGKVGFPFWNLQPSDWPRVLQVNLLGAVNTAHVMAPRLIESGPGASMLFLTSVAGQIGSQTDPPYSASKAALINFTQCAAKDLAPYEIRVNALSPGMVSTGLNRSIWAAAQEILPVNQRRSFEQWSEEKIRRVSPLGRWQQPEEIAALALFLASPLACNITGQTLNVDGGQVMHA